MRLNCIHQCLFYCGEAKWRIDDAIFRIAILKCSQRTFGILFSLMCDVENTQYIMHTHICICAMYTTKLRFFFVIVMKQFSMSPIFFHHIFCIDALLSLPLSKKFACVNIKLYYCIFWLCLVATLYFYNLFPSTFTHHCCCWPCKRLLVCVFFLALLFDIQSDFPHQPH